MDGNDRAKRRALRLERARRMWVGSAVSLMIDAWVMYGRAHHALYAVHISADGVLGPHWEDIGKALRGLLDAELGANDAIDLNKRIGDAFERCGYTREGEELH